MAKEFNTIDNFDVEDKTVLVRAYDAGNKNPYKYRSTTTIPFLQQYIDFGVVYMSGNDKQQALERIIAQENNYYEVPGRVLHSMKNIRLFTDISL